jgi:hypothetical protein
MAGDSHRAWRRVLAGVLAYALALQGFLFALDIGRPALAADDHADATAWAGFVLCTHGGGASSPVAPAQTPVGDLHCPFCIAGAVFVDCAPPCPPLWNKIVLTNAVWPSAAPRLVALFVNESAWPRGPPLAA